MLGETERRQKFVKKSFRGGRVWIGLGLSIFRTWASFSMSWAVEKRVSECVAEFERWGYWGRAGALSARLSDPQGHSSRGAGCIKMGWSYADRGSWLK